MFFLSGAHNKSHKFLLFLQLLPALHTVTTRCAPTPVVGPAPALFIRLLVLKAALKDANVMAALFSMASNVFPWTTVDVCTMADI